MNHRCTVTERELKTDSTFLKDIKTKGYIRKLEPGEVDDGPSGYLPHFPVVREDKETTKARIVYDSAARYGGINLNDTMLPGPNLQQDIFDVLLRFRGKAVALVADLTETFSQVIMAKKDRRYHRFLWRGLDLTTPLDVYEAIRRCLETALRHTLPSKLSGSMQKTTKISALWQ